jgi:hypothetical protein
MPVEYFPEYHDFEHIAVAPWPTITSQYDNLDWVNAVECLELWLNRYVGSHYAEWAYSNGTSHTYWQACIAFRQARSKTLFLLTWA